MLRPRLAGPDRLLRLLDRVEQAPPAAGERVELVRAELTDPEALAAACAGVDAVLHLAALASEDTWEQILRTNVEGTRLLLEAARRADVPRVVLASSIHAAGFYRRAGTDPQPSGVPAPDGPDGVPADVYPRPDSYYGWSKAAVESLGSLFADRFGMTVFAVRIGSCFPEPPEDHARSSWLSPDDCGRLMNACLRSDRAGFHLLWGVSANTDRWWSLREGREIGYAPTDDAEPYFVERRSGGHPTDGLLGGAFTTGRFGAPKP